MTWISYCAPARTSQHQHRGHRPPGLLARPAGGSARSASCCRWTRGGFLTAVARRRPLGVTTHGGRAAPVSTRGVGRAGQHRRGEICSIDGRGRHAGRLRPEMIAAVRAVVDRAGNRQRGAGELAHFAPAVRPAPTRCSRPACSTSAAAHRRGQGGVAGGAGGSPVNRLAGLGREAWWPSCCCSARSRSLAPACRLVSHGNPEALTSTCATGR